MISVSNISKSPPLGPSSAAALTGFMLAGAFALPTFLPFLAYFGLTSVVKNYSDLIMLFSFEKLSLTPVGHFPSSKCMKLEAMVYSLKASLVMIRPGKFHCT